MEKKRQKFAHLLDNFSFEKPLDHIYENIYLGDRQDSENLEELQKANITHILITGNNLKSYFPDKFKYKVLPLENYDWNADLSELIESALDFMKEGTCFVHCIAGMHRSPTFVLAYLIREAKMTVEEAYQHTKSRRKVIDPPQRFLDQLKQYQLKIGIAENNNNNNNNHNNENGNSQNQPDLVNSLSQKLDLLTTNGSQQQQPQQQQQEEEELNQQNNNIQK